MEKKDKLNFRKIFQKHFDKTVSRVVVMKIEPETQLKKYILEFNGSKIRLRKRTEYKKILFSYDFKTGELQKDNKSVKPEFKSLFKKAIQQIAKDIKNKKAQIFIKKRSEEKESNLKQDNKGT